MFVGDSMTIGSTGDFTWRYRMWQHLNAAYDGPYRIVGPRHTLHDPTAGTATSSAYADPGFPMGPAAIWPAGVRAGCTWPR